MQYKRDDLIFIDTCSLLELPASELFLKSLRISKKKVIVLRAVTDEIRRKINDKDSDISSRAQKIFNLIFDYEAAGFVQIGLDDDKNNRHFADNIFLGAAFKYGLNNNIIVITQDKKLAEDLLSLKNSKSVNGLNISVKRLENNGTLSDFNINNNNSINGNALEIPASQLLNQFKNNHDAGEKVYKNQCLLFSGRVVRVYEESNKSGKFITELLSDDEKFRGRIICRFNDSKEINNFERGQNVKISGLLMNVDIDFGDIELSECSTARKKTKNSINSFHYQLTTIPNEKIKLSQYPEIGSTIKCMNGKEYILSGIIGRGRKSTVYEIESLDGKTGEFAAKIYYPDYCTKRQFEKLKLIISLGLKYDGICFPLDIILNEHGEFCGCLMLRADGDKLDDMFCTPNEFKRRYSDWKKTDMVILTLNILDKIKYLHENNILMGNIVPENIMLMSTQEIYFVDADSWQYREFPCPDGDVYSTAPEIQGKNFNEFLRTMGNENFGVAVLVFRLMMQGFPPYASYEREMPEDEIREGKFPYSVGEFKPVKDYKAPAMEARRIWSHLVRQIKDSFMNTFNENGEHFSENTRYSVDQWIKDVNYYYSCLPKMIKTDIESEEIFPKETRKAKDKRTNI